MHGEHSSEKDKWGPRSPGTLSLIFLVNSNLEHYVLFHSSLALRAHYQSPSPKSCFILSLLWESDWIKAVFLALGPEVLLNMILPLCHFRTRDMDIRSSQLLPFGTCTDWVNSIQPSLQRVWELVNGESIRVEWWENKEIYSKNKYCLKC